MSWNIWPLSNKRKKNVVGITTRAAKNHFSWLEELVRKECSDLFKMMYLPITNHNRWQWEKEVSECNCSAIILYHSRNQGRLNVTDVDGALYDEELRYLNTVLGREKVVVLLDDMDDTSEEERQRILRTQRSLDRLSSHLILIPRKCKSEVAKEKLTEFHTALSGGMKTSQQKDSPGVFSSFVSKYSGSSGDIGHSDSKNNDKGKTARHTTDFPFGNILSSINPSQLIPHPYQIGIFSRAAESHYTWLIRSLKADGYMRSPDIKSVCITNDYKTFRSGLQTCRLAILYHTLKQGRLNITDVSDSLYDKELQEMSGFLGRQNVIVVVDDLKSSEPEDKERILTHQPSIRTYAEDLFLFTEEEKHTRNLETIKDIIWRRPGKQKGPGTKHQASPREWEPSKKNPEYSEYSVDGHKNIIPPNGSNFHFPPQTSFQKSHTREPQLEKSKISSNQQSISIGLLPGLPDYIKSGDTVHSDTMNNGNRDHAQHAIDSRYSKPNPSPPPPYQIGIFSRSAESNYKWLSDSLKAGGHMRSFDIKSVYITNDYKTFGSGLKTCRFAILYHTQKHGRLNITDVADSLYNKELRDMSNVLGRENVIVVVDDLKSSEPKDKEQMLEQQPSIRTCARDLFLFTEEKKCTSSLQTIKEMIWKGTEHQAAPPRGRESSMKNPGYSVVGQKNRITPEQGSAFNSLPSSSGTIGHQTTSQKSSNTEPQSKRSKILSSSEQTDSIELTYDQLESSKSDDMENGDITDNGKREHAQDNTDFTFMPNHSLLPPYQIGIFSRSAESNYKWLSDSLKANGHMRSFDIKSVYITNDYKTFGSGLETCRFAILYHTQKHGRLNITDVTDSLYDTELKDMSGFLGRENVIVVVDDLKSSEPKDKEQMLEQQPSIRTYARDLFLFTEEKKCTSSLQTIKEMIWKGRENVIVVVDDLKSSEPKDKEQMLEQQPSIRTYARDLFLFTEEKKCTSSLQTIKEMIWKGAGISQREESCGGISSITSTGSGSSGDTEHNKTNNSKGEHRRSPTAGTSGKSSKPSHSPLSLYKIGIFSRCAESNYTWLADRMKADDRMRSLDIKSVCITNDDKTFRSGLETCRFAILYHTQKHGRLNITDVTNSLYDEELQEMSRVLGKENVIVVADDLTSSKPKDKDRILTHQPSIRTYAKDLFIFAEYEKNTRNLEEIKEIIWSRQAKYTGPDTEHQAAPSRERYSPIKNTESSSDGLKKRITPDQGSTLGSLPSYSGSVGHQTTSQKSDNVEPQIKRSKTLSDEQTYSMGVKCDQPEAPSPDLLSAPNKQLNDLQQENRELRKAILYQKETIKELENSVKSLTLDKHRALEQMKKIIEREERNVDGYREEIVERKNVLQQREKGKGMDVLPREGEEGAHGYDTPHQRLERIPETGHCSGEHLQKTAGSSCLQNQDMNEQLTKIQELINEKNRKLQEAERGDKETSIGS